MNYLKNHIFFMALLAISCVFSVYGAPESQPGSAPNQAFWMLPIIRNMPRMYRLDLCRQSVYPCPLFQSQIRIKPTEPETIENTTKQEPEVISNRLKLKFLSSFPRIAWHENGDKIINYAIKCWSHLVRFF